MKNTPKNIAIEKLFPFEGHPFKVQDNEEMNALIESIQEQGILSPLIVRPKENTADEYEIVSGHRRFRAAVKAGIKEVPALIVPLDRDAAAIAVVDSNLHREHILPSEKAFAYKLKAEALRHQGKRSDLTSEQVAPKLATEIIAESDNTSKDTVKRYIRLTNLIPPIWIWLMKSGLLSLLLSSYPICSPKNRQCCCRKWSTVTVRLIYLRHSV